MPVGRKEIGMAALTPTNITVERDALGFLLHAEHWSRQIAESIARDNGINDLTDRHWQVISSMRSAFVQHGSTPSLRMLSRVADVPIEELFRLFPIGPSRLVAKIAGIPKLRACL
jgi:dissimilatory sulfite reductase related protein